MFKKLISLSLSLCTVFLLLSACNNKSDVATDSANTTNPAGSQEISSQPTETTDAFTEPAVPDNLKFSGVKFTFLMNANPYWEGRSDIYAEELTGEPLNDAIYNRNKQVEAKFGIEIGQIAEYGNKSNGTGPAYQRITKDVNAGDNTYDAAIICGYEASTLAYNGFLQNLKIVPYMNLDNVWWDQRANKDLSINNKLYMTTGDISWLINDASYGILFNKKLASDYQMPNFYDLVKNNKWTIDKWAELTKLVSKDLNGDSKMDKNDLFGSVIWDDSVMGIVNSAGAKCATVSPQGDIELTLNTPNVISALEKYLTAAEDKNTCFAYQRSDVSGSDFFANNQALFYIQLIEEAGRLRGMETDFGILPYPKLDENQEGYPSSITPFSSIFFVIPQKVANLEMSGAVAEDMAYWSKKLVRPAYYDITLKVKGTRDEESVEMLDIILANRVFDLGWYYNIGGFTDGLLNLFRNYKTDFVSMYDKNEAKAMDKLKTINDAYKSIE